MCCCTWPRKPLEISLTGAAGPEIPHPCIDWRLSSHRCWRACERMVRSLQAPAGRPVVRRACGRSLAASVDPNRRRCTC
nr:unnamed protein product [Digitaria exilis]